MQNYKSKKILALLLSGVLFAAITAFITYRGDVPISPKTIPIVTRRPAMVSLWMPVLFCMPVHVIHLRTNERHAGFYILLR